MNYRAACGFTLAELLTVTALLAIIAAMATPLLSSGDAQKLAVAAEETANILRFALSEARRTGGYVLVDGKSAPGRLRLYQSTATAQLPPVAGTSAVNDPLTKRPTELDPARGAFSPGVALTPQFRAGGSIRPQLLVGPGISQLQGFDGAGASSGPLQANSGVLLQFGQLSATVSIDHVTGRVTLP